MYGPISNSSLYDEILIVGCILFATIYLKLHKLKYNLLPFRGINIIFMKDFLQFSPIIDTTLYSTNIKPIFMFTKSTIKKSYVKASEKITLS
jgi:hypothetical protein